MATISANGGASQFWRHAGTGSRAVLCRNGKILINPGGNNGWKRTLMTVAGLRDDRGWIALDDASSRAAVSRTTAESHAREQSKRLRRLRRRIDR
jgi:hypothetical protein